MYPPYRYVCLYVPSVQVCVSVCILHTGNTYTHACIYQKYMHTFIHKYIITHAYTVLVDQSSPGLSTFHTISQQQENTFCKRTRSAVTWPHAHPPNICVLICVLVCVRAGAALYMCSYMCPYMCADPPNGRLVGGLYVLGGGSRDHAAVYVGFVHQHVCIFG